MKANRPKIETILGNEEEMRRCAESPLYFYNNYVRPEGSPELTQEQFDAYVREMEAMRNASVRIRKRNTGYTYLMTFDRHGWPDFLQQPLTPSECTRPVDAADAMLLTLKNPPESPSV